jgi:hypothetical protein
MAENPAADLKQAFARPKKFKLGPLGTLNQLLTAGSRTLRAMADGSLDGQLGARLMNGLGIQRSILELQSLMRIEAKLDAMDATIDVTPNRRLEDFHGYKTSNHEISRAN